MAKRNKQRVLTRSNKKTIVQHAEIIRFLSPTEIMQLLHIINKIERFDEKETYIMTCYKAGAD